MDMPPARWFLEPFSRGELKGVSLDRPGYEQMLSWYYESRGWNENGAPKNGNSTKTGIGRRRCRIIPLSGISKIFEQVRVKESQGEKIIHCQLI
jgi:hypothetical protein